jgi:steroid 5-alpha reductase family enzyme
MEDTIITGIQAIQAILAPALGISATALLMLSTTNRYSSIISRIRLLNEERRRITGKLATKTELDYGEKIRYSSVIKQIEKILERCKGLRNSILFFQTAILLFVMSSITIAINLFISTNFLRTLPVIIFSVGMILLLIGEIYSAKDIYHSYKVAEIEVKADE